MKISVSDSKQSRNFSRRSFVSLAAGAAATIAAPAIGMGGVAVANAAANQQDPKSGGTLRVVYAEEPKNLNLRIDSGTEGVMVLMQIYDGLLNFGPNGEVVPGLATGLPEQSDETTYIFKLREGVTFHDGKPFTADDVVWTVDRLLGNFPDLVSSQAARFGSQIENAEKIDDYTVQFNLKHPWADFISLIVGDKSLRIEQKNPDRENNDAYDESLPVGTGPFRFKEWVVGDHLTLERNDDYWDEAAFVDEVVYRAIPEEATRMNALQAGEIDILLVPALKDLESLSENPNFDVLAAEGGNRKYLGFNTTKEPFTDKKVRQAISYAIDRQEIVDGIYYGYATVAQGILPPWSEASNSDQTFYPYDPEKAQELLAEAGYDGEELEFEIVTTNATEYVDLSTLIASQLERVGITASILPLDKSAFTERTFQQDGSANPGYQASVYRLIFGYSLTDYGWRIYHPDSVLNGYGYNQPGGAQNEAVLPLLDETTQTLEAEKQRELYSKVSELILDDAPDVIIAWQKNVLVSRAEVKDLGIGAVHYMPFRQVWLDE